ncbi:MAG: hypothetical protein PV340_04005 [Wolbachia sp.]|nr:hypothetical protein [Wolbachia sp.]MDD9336816.1 hypothetical protein [Wolbachia sp.]
MLNATDSNHRTLSSLVLDAKDGNNNGNNKKLSLLVLNATNNRSEIFTIQVAGEIDT